jgi:hypothetical protein
VVNPLDDLKVRALVVHAAVTGCVERFFDKLAAEIFGKWPTRGEREAFHAWADGTDK